MCVDDFILRMIYAVIRSVWRVIYAVLGLVTGMPCVYVHNFAARRKLRRLVLRIILVNDAGVSSPYPVIGAHMPLQVEVPFC